MRLQEGNQLSSCCGRGFSLDTKVVCIRTKSQTRLATHKRVVEVDCLASEQKKISNNMLFLYKF